MDAFIVRLNYSMDKVNKNSGRGVFWKMWGLYQNINTRTGLSLTIEKMTVNEIETSAECDYSYFNDDGEITI